MTATHVAYRRRMAYDTEQITTANHHFFVVLARTPFDTWLQPHLADMEAQGFRVVSTTVIQENDDELLAVTMARN